MQALESLSMIILSKFWALASCTAHSIASTPTERGIMVSASLDAAKTIVPLQTLATTATIENSLPTAALQLNFTCPFGG